MKIKASVDRYLEQHDVVEDADEDEDEDDLEEGKIIGQLFVEEMWLKDIDIGPYVTFQGHFGWLEELLIWYISCISMCY